MSKKTKKASVYAITFKVRTTIAARHVKTFAQASASACQSWIRLPGDPCASDPDAKLVAKPRVENVGER